MLLPTTKTGEIDVDRLVALLKQANTPNDNDALDAFRQAEALVYGADKDWRELIPKRFRFDLDNLPPLLRESDIVRDPKRGYPGILPMTRSAFRSAIADGYIPAPLKLGAKVVAWRKEDIVYIARNGVVGRREKGRRARAREAQRLAGKVEAPADT
jgi:hypothetical protein